MILLILKIVRVGLLSLNLWLLLLRLTLLFAEALQSINVVLQRISSRITVVLTIVPIITCFGVTTTQLLGALLYTAISVTVALRFCWRLLTAQTAGSILTLLIERLITFRRFLLVAVNFVYLIGVVPGYILAHLQLLLILDSFQKRFPTALVIRIQMLLELLLGLLLGILLVFSLELLLLLEGRGKVVSVNTIIGYAIYIVARNLKHKKKMKE